MRITVFPTRHRGLEIGWTASIDGPKAAWKSIFCPEFTVSNIVAKDISEAERLARKCIDYHLQCWEQDFPWPRFCIKCSDQIDSVQNAVFAGQRGDQCICKACAALHVLDRSISRPVSDKKIEDITKLLEMGVRLKVTDEKIGDAINYLILLEAILTERNGRVSCCEVL